ncbi:MAG: aminoglycoside phosphotransferase family protein [Clostridia bacterium]|nr:aminoglycoside phosphotransferase family protein [Clostridia bacterium]
MMNSSSVYRDLTEQELHVVIERSLHTMFTSYEPLTGGLFNTTYRIRTADCGTVVLRAGPVNRHLLMTFEHELMISENEVYSLCSAKGIPVSDVLVCDTTKTILDRDFMIVRNIPSCPMSQCEQSLSPDDYARICREIGEATRRFHAIEGTKFGRIAEVKRGGGFDRWSDCMMTEFERWDAVAAPTGIYSPAERDAARAALTDAADILDEIATPRLAHCDLWFGNILVTKDEHPEFAAIIDADRAMWGDTEIDFSSIPWTKESPSFWDGYGSPLPMDAHSRIRRLIYTMMWSLFDSYVWHNQYHVPDSTVYTKNKALTQIRTLCKDYGIGTEIG